jgi:Trm5-related predicted tRNA methylase
VAGLLGLAFDADDGQTRITRGKQFFLAGGSEDSHDRMRETVVKVTEKLDQRGQQLTDVSVQQLCDLLEEAQS